MSGGPGGAGEKSGALLPKITGHLKARPCALISVYKPGLSDGEKEENQKALEKEIRSIGYGFMVFKGFWDDGAKSLRREEALALLVKMNDGSPDDFPKSMAILRDMHKEDAVIIFNRCPGKGTVYYADGKTADLGDFSLEAALGALLCGGQTGGKFILGEPNEENIDHALYYNHIARTGTYSIRKFLIKYRKFR